MTKVLPALLAALMFGAAAQAANLECIVPSKPGGAMDLTCKLAQKGLQGLRGTPKPPPSDMHISYLPGGIGAVAWHSLVSQRRAEPNTLVAFSGGSLLNLAQGKFGKAKADDVRWVAALGADYGMIAVRADSPYKTLGELVAALKSHPQKVLIGVSGTIGSQDWLKMAMVARPPASIRRCCVSWRWKAAAKPSPRCTPISCRWCRATPAEATLYAASGNTRVLAVLSEQRLPGVLASVPTAREQGLMWCGRSSAACGWDHTCRTPTTIAGCRPSTASWPVRSSRRCARAPAFIPSG
jgi:putative tricarboxylic transport membrane protein